MTDQMLIRLQWSLKLGKLKKTNKETGLSSYTRQGELYAQEMNLNNRAFDYIPDGISYIPDFFFTATLESVDADELVNLRRIDEYKEDFGYTEPTKLYNTIAAQRFVDEFNRLTGIQI